jgi:hypothetical protein
MHQERGVKYSNTDQKAGRGEELPGGDFEGPCTFTVCITARELLLRGDVCFRLFHQSMLW